MQCCEKENFERTSVYSMNSKGTSSYELFKTEKEGGMNKQSATNQENVF